ncbi:MAG: hypothetical protein V4819_10505 [Verrucomicrobiota bacterium]
MNVKNRLAGRFLPSRVYARWKWTVRFGLSALPLTLFIAGGVTYYLTPSRYESTADFEYLGKRPPAEAAALLRSGNVIAPAIANLKLTERMGMDTDSLSQQLVEAIRTTVDSGTGMIELTVENLQGEIARDLAAELPKSLDDYEKSLATAEIKVRLEGAEESVTEGEDEADAKRQDLARLISVRGQAVDPVSQLDLDAARGDWDHAYQRVLESRAKVADARRELSAPGKWVVIHSPPTISNEPVIRKSGDSMGEIIGESLGAGLAFALLAPYLLELAFPRRRALGSARKGPWLEAADSADFSGEPANG